MKKIITFILVIFIATNVYAQDRETDSLKVLLGKEKTDTGRVNLLIAIGSRFGFGIAKNDSSLWYSQQALDVAKKIKYPKGEIGARLAIANFLSRTGNYPEALKISLYNLKMAEQYHDNDRLFYQTRLVGWIYRDLGNNEKHLEYEKRLNLLVNSGVFDGMPGKRLYETGANNCVAQAYASLNMHDSALYYELLAYHSALKLTPDNAQMLSLATSVLGAEYSEMENYDSAFFFYKMSIPYAINAGRRDVLARSKAGIAGLFYKKGQLDSALFYGRQSLEEAQTTYAMRGLADIYLLLSKLYQSNRQYDSAYKYLQLSDVMKDSLFNQNKIAQAQNLAFNETLQQQQVAQAKKDAKQQYENRLKLYSLGTVIFIILIIAFLLYRNLSNKRKANILLTKQKEEIQNTLSELKSTQQQLIQSEKMASLGELTAGIAHEIQNPLNFVNNFSDVNKELLLEIKEELDNGNYNEVKEIVGDVISNEEKISHHGKRADSIVKGMLEHSRTSKGEKQPTNINALADEYLRLAYHGLRAKDKSFNVDFQTHFDESIGKINIVPQDIGRVLLNLYNNAFYAVNEKKSKLNGTFEPLVSLTTQKQDGSIILKVADNGNGIPQNIINKIYQPFFTTKPTGQGTGLGLSLSYDIIKATGGEINVQSKEGEGTEFIISLPA